MRIKVRGELTEGRLKEAVALLGAKGHSLTCFFDGYLTVQPAEITQTSHATEKGADGDVMEEVDQGLEIGSDDDWNGPLPAYISGIFDHSPEAVEIRRLQRRNTERIEQAHLEAAALKKRLIREHMANKEIFGRLVLRFGGEFINAINLAISAVWGEVKPVFRHDGKGGKEGEPRPMPQVELRGTTVSLCGYNTTGATKRILTPLSETDSMAGAGPIWKYREWTECAVPRIREVIESFARQAGLERVGRH